MNSTADPPASAVKPVFLPAHLREALAHAAIEGMRPLPEGRSDLEDVARGLLDEQAFLVRVKARYGL